MNIEKMIKENIDLIKTTIGGVYVSPDIPEKKMNNAVSHIAKGIAPEYVLALVDTTIFGSAKEGMVFVGDRLYINNRGLFEIAFENLTSIEKKEIIDKDKNGNDIVKYQYSIEYDGEKIDITDHLSYLDADGFMELMQLIIDAVKNSEGGLETTNQTCPLSMMSPDIQEAYVKLLCNFAYSDDGVIDAYEYTEIMTLVAINSIGQDVRLSIRSYMCDSELVQSDESIIEYLCANVEAGSLDALKLSMVKDVINLFWNKMSPAHEKDEWKTCDYIVNLVKKMDIDEEQVDYIVENIKSNKAMIANRMDDLQIKKNMQELAAKASAVGVPLAAIYLSGSVVGVSAAGITSGLAALGMGGVLGFSGMVTGIGVAVLLGVGAYKGVKKVTGMGDLEKNKQREKMLQEIARNAQKALNYLIEDVNELTQRLQNAIANEQEQEIKIQKIVGMMAMMSKGAGMTSNQIEYAEREQLICRLPVNIKKDIIEELTSGATKVAARELIYSAYDLVKVDENGGQIENCLNTDLSLTELENVYAALEGIGFYNIAESSKAHAINAAKEVMKGIRK